MQALTGVRSTTIEAEGNDMKGGGVLHEIKERRKSGAAVAIGTKADDQEASVDWTEGKFTKTGNVFTATLDPSLVFETVQVMASARHSFTGKDDSNNNMVQTGGSARLKAGKVDYQKGRVTLTFDPHAAPEDAESFSAAWSHCGEPYQRYGLIGGHEYRVTDVKEPDALYLHNPWGFQHPKPVDGEGVSKLFSEIAVNQVPKDAPKATGGRATKKKVHPGNG
jgi:hypothetical protein